MLCDGFHRIQLVIILVTIRLPQVNGCEALKSEYYNLVLPVNSVVEEVVKVTRKYQITIPKKVRKRVGVEIGDELKVMEKDEAIILTKAGEKRSISALAGCWKGYPENPDELMKELRKLWATWQV